MIAKKDLEGMTVGNGMFGEQLPVSVEELGDEPVEVPCYPTARSVNASLRCPSKTVYGITLQGKKVRIFAYRGASRPGEFAAGTPTRPPQGRTGNGVWTSLNNVEVE